MKKFVIQPFPMDRPSDAEGCLPLVGILRQRAEKHGCFRGGLDAARQVLYSGQFAIPKKLRRFLLVIPERSGDGMALLIWSNGKWRIVVATHIEDGPKRCRFIRPVVDAEEGSDEK